VRVRGLLIAAIVLAALSGALYWSNHRKPAESSANSTIESSPKILTLESPAITGISLRKKSGDTLVLAKNDAGQWQITAPKELPADQDAVSSIVSTLSSLNSERVVDDQGANLDQYGLAQPSLLVEITKKDKKTQQLLIGDDTPTGNGVYAGLAGDPRVFTMSSYNRTSLDKSANDLRDKRLLPFDSDKVSSIELTAKKQTVAFGRSKDQWQIVKPKPFRADHSQVEDLLRTLRDARMDLSAAEDQKKLAAAFSSATPFATARVTDVSKSYFLTHSGADWWSNGTKMDSSTVSVLIDKIRDLSAGNFAETGFAASALDLAVTSGGGTRIEKVSFSKVGDKYLAKRDSEPALYLLEASAVTDLQKSAADLKPAAAPVPPAGKK
jgi:hypothetical protein